MTQSRIDSWIEATANTFVGFVIAFLVQHWIIQPLWHIPGGAAGSFAITCIFTVASLLRQYILRRVFNGRSPGAWLLLQIGHTQEKSSARR